MTAPHRIEQHDGRGWRTSSLHPTVSDANWSFAFLRDEYPNAPIRIVEAESRRIVALHDPRHGYAYPETTT